MSKYILLLGEHYYPQGWDDFKGVYDTVEEAIAASQKIESYFSDYNEVCDWGEIISTETWRVVMEAHASDDYKTLIWEE